MPDVDIITVGRVNFDLYAQETGVEFTDVRGWDAMVGGCPANVALAGARLGLRTAPFTAVGEDLVGDWTLAALRREGVDTQLVLRKPEGHTSLALRAQVAPDHPLAFFRQNPADIHLSVSDAQSVPIENARALLISADAFARGTTADATRVLLARAHSKVTTYLDLDLREVNWRNLDDYAATVAPLLDDVDVVVGTEEEFGATLRIPPADAVDAVGAIVERLSARPSRVFIVKQGARGATLLRDGAARRIAGYEVTEASTVGAGDTFAAGLMYARLAGRPWIEACQFACACAAITVSRFGCSAGFPRREEVEHFLASREREQKEAT